MNTISRFLVLLLLLGASLVGCGENASQKGDSGRANSEKAQAEKRDTIWDLFEKRADENVTIGVNKYLWFAALQVLDFMPITFADPFGGVIVFDYGKVPGAAQSYRGMVLISDPALDLRALHLSLSTRDGPVSDEILRQVEDAILSQARNLRIKDKAL